MLLLRIYARNENIYSYNNLYTHIYSSIIHSNQASQVALVVKDPSANAGDVRRWGFDPWVRKISWRRKWQPTPVSLPGKCHGQRSLVGYSPWGCKKSDMTEHARIIAGKIVGPKRLVTSQCLERLPSMGSWLPTGKNLRESNRRVKKGLFREKTHSTDRVWAILEGKSGKRPLGMGLSVFIGVGYFIG